MVTVRINGCCHGTHKKNGCHRTRKKKIVVIVSVKKRHWVLTQDIQLI
jgi:hypothetical protein